MKLQTILGAAAIAVTLMGTTALTLPAFAANVPDGTKLAEDQTFNYRVLDNINALDPNIVEDVDTSYVVTNLFEGLYNEDAKGNPIPGVAESYEANADFTVYTFHLRDALWSNGDPVKASDFVYSWQRAVDPKTASNYSYFLGLVGVKNADDIVAGKLPITDLGVKAVDDKTLEVSSRSRCRISSRPRRTPLCSQSRRPSSRSSVLTGRSPKTSSATAPMCWPRTRRASA